MPLQKLLFTPGVNRDQTNYSNEGGWFACDKIRFRSGFPEKLGGWQTYPTSGTIKGICRQMFGWITSYGDNFLAIGTNIKVYIEAGGYIYDVTPVDRVLITPATDNCIDTTNTSNIVTFNVTSHGGSTGDYVIISGVAGSGSPANIGGIPITEINAEHLITVLDANTFTIQTTTAATSTTTGQGGTAIVLTFLLPTGFPITTYGYGWGTGAWSGNQLVPPNTGWGLNTNTPINFIQRDWWFDQFDNDLVMNVREGGIYIWERGATANPTTSLNTRAIPLSDLPGATDVPDIAMQILVAQTSRTILAFGCTPFGGGDADPLLIRWTNLNDPGNWTPSSTSSAGFIRLSRGSAIVRAIPTRQEILVFTESGLTSLQETGTIEVFNPQEMGENVSIIGPRAVTVVNNTAFWMGHDKFYAYTGTINTLPCTLRNHVFQNINYDQVDQIICGTNEGWNEVWWNYPSANSQVNDSYIIYNHLEKIWYYGSLNRTAWLDNPLREYPQAANGTFNGNPFFDPTSVTTIYNHEQGVNDDTLPMESYIESSDFDLQEGDQFILVKRMLPDLTFAGSTATNPMAYVTLKPRNFPGSNYQTEENLPVIETSSVPVEQFTEQVFIRARARQVAFKVGSTELGVQWQLGAPRLDGRPDGKR
jgi:hypothetical protein